MQSKSKSKPKSLKNLSLGLKQQKGKFSNSSIQLTLIPIQHDRHNCKKNPKKTKKPAQSKSKKQDVIKKMQMEIREIKGQILQLKSQCTTTNLTQVSTNQYLSSQSSQSMKERGRRKISHFKNQEQSKVNGFQLIEHDKENKNGENLSMSNILCTEELKQPGDPKCSASFYHENRVKYRNLEQSNYYIDYYLLN